MRSNRRRSQIGKPRRSAPRRRGDGDEYLSLFFILDQITDYAPEILLTIDLGLDRLARLADLQQAARNPASVGDGAQAPPRPRQLGGKLLDQQRVVLSQHRCPTARNRSAPSSGLGPCCSSDVGSQHPSLHYARPRRRAATFATSAAPAAGTPPAAGDFGRIAIKAGPVAGGLPRRQCPAAEDRGAEDQARRRQPARDVPLVQHQAHSSLTEHRARHRAV